MSEWAQNTENEGPPNTLASTTIFFSKSSEAQCLFICLVHLYVVFMGDTIQNFGV